LIKDRLGTLALVLLCVTSVSGERRDGIDGALIDGPFQVACGHSLQKIRREKDELASMRLQHNSGIELELAREESESFQLVVIPNERSIQGVEVSIGPLKNRSGRQLNLRWHRVGYVKSGRPAEYRPEYVGWWPDPLMPPGIFDVAAGEIQPLWFTVAADQQTESGLYQGSILIRLAEYTQSVQVTVRVRDFALPRPGTLAAPFGLYRRSIESWYGQKMAPEEFNEWCQFMAGYRLTPKNLGVEYKKNVRAPSADSNDGGQGTVDRVDMTTLRKTVGKMNDDFPPYSYGFYRLPGCSSLKQRKVDQAAAQRYADVVKMHYDEWRRQGFGEEAYLYGVDEVTRECEDKTRDIYAAIKRQLPQVKIMQTLGSTLTPKLAGLVDIWCPKTYAVGKTFYDQRRQAGDTIWLYVCCSPVPPYGNFFVDVPSIDHRILFWQTKKAAATGFLYWTVAQWDPVDSPASGKPCFPDIPFEITKQRMYAGPWKVNGDGLLVYPGKNMTPLPSIRLEVIRDGIEDFEYLALLEKLVNDAEKLPASRQPAQPMIAEARKLCGVPDRISHSFTEFTKDPELILTRRKQIAEMIEKLDGILTSNQN